MSRKFKKVGLALGAGGARGLVHIGVLKAFRDHSIPINMVTGTSVGSVIGAMYAATLDPDWVERKFKEFIRSDFYKSLGLDRIRPVSEPEASFVESVMRPVKEVITFRVVNERLGLLKSDRLAAVIRYLLPVRKFEQLKIPFRCVAVNLNNGEDVIFRNGDLIHALTSSSSIPGYMQPVRRNGDLLVDGGVTTPFPVNLLREMGGELTVAVDVNIQKFHPLVSPNLLNILSRVDQITSNKLSYMIRAHTDIVIKPETDDLFWAEFEKMDKLVSNGYNAVCNQVDEIRSKVYKTGFFGKLFRYSQN